MSAGLDDLKKNVFYDLLELAGRVFIQVRHSDQARIGTRGFLAEEKENGIVLVFNRKMNFSWDDQGITTTLVFGTTPQKCFIPISDILSVFSPDLQAYFSVRGEGGETGDQNEGPGKASKGERVVRVDFRKKNQQ